MDQLPVAERLPRHYRAVLDAVARLEAIGRRREAAVIRSEATLAYSKAWNAVAERRLLVLHSKAIRIIQSQVSSLGAVPDLARSIDLERTVA